MSGVAGCFSRGGRPVVRNALSSMLGAASYRAVDGWDVYLNCEVGLAHQHFWISPQEAEEQQPLCDPATGCVISADVRLDNRLNLARRLALNTAEQTSDAELVLRAYLRWGTDCATHLEGDFAFVVWDARKRQLLLVRDRLGVRDLCFYIDNDWLVAASEVKQVLAHPSVPRRVNRLKIAQFLMDDWSDQAATFYRDVHFLWPGCCALVTEKSWRCWRYWSPNVLEQIRHRDERDYHEEFRGLLTDAVRSRLRIQGDCGVSLSGGPDSASLAPIITRCQPSTSLKTYSYVFDQYPACDERPYLDPIVEALRLDPTYVHGDQLRVLGDLGTWPVFEDFASQDPFVRLGVAVLDAAAADGIRVLFNGHFSDVLFSGGRYWAQCLLDSGEYFEFIRLAASSAGRSTLVSSLLRYYLGGITPAVLKRLLVRGDARVAATWDERFPADVVRLLEVPSQTGPAVAGVGNQVPRTRLWHCRRLIAGIEPQGSSAYRSISNTREIEIVDPFWDQRLVEYVLAVPAHVLGRPEVPKWLLRQAMHGQLPDTVLWRTDKTSLQGFFHDGMFRHAWRTVIDLMANPLLVESGCVRHEWVEELLRVAGKDGECAASLWQCLCVELWLRQNRSAL